MEEVLTAGQPRPLQQRKADTLAKLTAPAADGWIATASAEPGHDPRPYLVPLSIAWIDETVVIAVDAASRTAANLRRTGTARVGLGPTRDVVLIDVTARASHPQSEVPERLARSYAAQADWDPSEPGGTNVYFVLEPMRIQAWREVNELAGRTLMSRGRWTV
ncbi:MAG TPA: hypothetical protein VFU35_00345 [Jatrophihabitans sp.]|nr:hypothetical protein [Jatrophihabitans sp.]